MYPSPVHRASTSTAAQAFKLGGEECGWDIRAGTVGSVESRMLILLDIEKLTNSASMRPGADSIQ